MTDRVCLFSVRRERCLGSFDFRCLPNGDNVEWGQKEVSLASYEPDDGFDLDYDEDIGDTRQVQVIPWSGEVLDFDDDFGETRQVTVDPMTGEVVDHLPTPTPTPAPHTNSSDAFGDPDRTCRVAVDPMTGEVLESHDDVPAVVDVVSSKGREAYPTPTPSVIVRPVSTPPPPPPETGTVRHAGVTPAMAAVIAGVAMFAGAAIGVGFTLLALY